MPKSRPDPFAVQQDDNPSDIDANKSRDWCKWIVTQIHNAPAGALLPETFYSSISRESRESRAFGAQDYMCSKWLQRGLINMELV